MQMRAPLTDMVAGDLDHGWDWEEKKGVRMRVVNCGVCREGLIDVVFLWSHKC